MTQLSNLGDMLKGSVQWEMGAILNEKDTFEQRPGGGPGMRLERGDSSPRAGGGDTQAEQAGGWVRRGRQQE